MDDSRNSFDIVNTPSSLEGKDEHKLEYIKMMIEIVQNDIKVVYLYITLIIGLMAFIISQFDLVKVLIFLPVGIRIATFIGVICGSIAAICFFRYIRELHITRMKMTRCIVSLDVTRVRELWAGEAGVWEQNKNKYNAGKIFISISIVMFLVLFVYVAFFIDPDLFSSVQTS